MKSVLAQQRGQKLNNESATIATSKKIHLHGVVPTASSQNVSSGGSFGDVTSPNDASRMAVHSYVKLVRSRGRTRINSAEVANALDMPVRDVEKILGGMVTKGADRF